MCVFMFAFFCVSHSVCVCLNECVCLCVIKKECVKVCACVCQAYISSICECFVVVGSREGRADYAIIFYQLFPMWATLGIYICWILNNRLKH